MIVIIPIVAIAALASLAMGRMYSRREHEEPQLPQTAPTEFDARLERVAQAVDVIASELERISENQRELTQVLARHTPVEKRIAGG